MKKFVTFLLITLYSLAMAGTTIAMHYCMGEKVSTTLGYEEQSVCEFCHMEKHTVQDQDNCCMDDHQFVKISPDQDVTTLTTAPQIPFLFLSAFILGADVSLSLANTPKKALDQYVVPPDIPTYQLNCNFRI